MKSNGKCYAKSAGQELRSRTESRRELIDLMMAIPWDLQSTQHRGDVGMKRESLLAQFLVVGIESSLSQRIRKHFG